MGEAGKPYLFECFQAGCHTLHTLHFTLLTPHSTLYTRHSFALFTPHSTLYTLHFPFHAPYFTLRTSHSTLSTPRSTLHTLHSTLYTLGWWSRDSCGASCHVLFDLASWDFRLCSASRFWSTCRDADVRSAGLNSFPGFISLLGAAATHCPGSRQTSSQACILCGCLYSMLFIVYVELEAWDLQHSRALIVCGHVNEGRVCLSLSLL